MFVRRPSRPAFRLAVFLLAWLVLATPPAHAQKVFKYAMPDGTVVYSDTPVPGGRLESELAPPPPPDAGLADEPRRAVDRLNESATTRSSALRAADEELRAANAALAAAQARLAAGRTPLDDEYLGTVAGRRRLAESYTMRQQTNEAAVAAAQARVDRARAALTELR